MAENRSCEICKINPSKYSCPKCNIGYCSVTCYQSESHLQCTETFFWECVEEEMKTYKCQPKDKKNMEEILEQQNQDSESESEHSLDSDDDEEAADLMTRMTNVNLDDEEAVWKKLTSEEIQDFRKLISTGEIMKMLPDWEPWWTIARKRAFIFDYKDTVHWQFLCPKLKSDVPELWKLTRIHPSPKIAFMVMNVLISYVYTTKFFKGAHMSLPVEATTTCIALSATLRSNEIMEDTLSAFLAFENDLAKCTWVDPTLYKTKEIQQDLLDIMRTSNEVDFFFSIRSALSDLSDLCSKALDILKDSKTMHLKRFTDPPPKISLLEQISRKITYYLAWTNVYGNSVVKLL